MRKANQKEFRIEKVIKRKGDNCTLNGKAAIVLLTVGLIKKTLWMSEYFPELKFLGGRVKVKLDLLNYATKADLKM